MTDEQQRTIPLSYVALPFAPDYVHDFIARSLQHRAEASESVRDALNSAIADSISVDGFKDASKASPHQLVDDVFHELVHGNRRLAAGVLRAWTESHEDLRDLVTRHLTESKMPADGPDLKERVFHSAWPRAEWLREIEAIVENRDDLDEEDVGMMLCCVSGRLPTAGDARAAIESPTLLGWLDRLRELPHDAPEWVDVEEFTEAVYRIADEKATERDSLQSEALAELLSGIRADFDAELRYLGNRPVVLGAERGRSPLVRLRDADAGEGTPRQSGALPPHSPSGRLQGRGGGARRREIGARIGRFSTLSKPGRPQRPPLRTRTTNRPRTALMPRRRSNLRPRSSPHRPTMLPTRWSPSPSCRRMSTKPHWASSTGSGDRPNR